MKKACIATLVALSFAQTVVLAAVDPAVDQLVRRQAVAYEDAFNKHDARAISEMWTPDGTYTDATGLMVIGRKEIERMFAQFFEDGKSHKIKIEIASVDSPEPGYVIERGRAILMDARGASLSTAPYVAVHKRVGEQWLMSLVNEATPYISDSMADLAWLAGNWKLKNGTGEHVMTNEIVNEGKVLLTTFEVPSTNGKKETDLMVTNADPATGRLLATIFDANGAHGRAVWRHHADGRWSIHSHRIHPDGTVITARHILKPNTEDSFLWSSSERSADGRPLPDTAEAEVTRVK